MISVQYRLRTLLVATTLTGLTLGGWALAMNAVGRGTVNLAQLSGLCAAWLVTLLAGVPRR